MSTFIPFKDSNLIEEIKRHLRVDHELTQGDMMKLEKLTLYREISDLSGIEFAENLHTLTFFAENTANLEPLLQLKNMRKLKIKIKNPSDFELICQLPQLNELDLSKSNISSIQFISSLKNLITLNLHNCNLYDIDALRQLANLRHLDIKYNYILDLSPIEDLISLQSLDVSRNQLSNINCIKKLSQLNTLIIDDNEITDISVLREIPTLKNLSISGNPISNIDVFRYLPNLSNISVVRINISAPTKKAKELIKLAKKSARQETYKFNNIATTTSCQLELSTALKSFVEQRNKEIPFVSDVKQLFNQLKLPPNPEQYVLLRILEDGYVATLKDMLELNIDPFILELYTNYAIDKSLATWAFQTWAQAYSKQFVVSESVTTTSTYSSKMEIQDEKNLLTYVKHNDLNAIQKQNNKKLNLNYKYPGNKTLLSIAIENQFSEMVKLLLEQGCDPNIPINKGKTALMLAIQSRNTTITSKILPYTTEINIQDSDGYTALHYAVSNEIETVVQDLINNGADLFIKTHRNKTPFEIAIHTKNLELCKTLISSEPKRFLQYKFQYDDYALNLAIRYNFYDLCVYLIELSKLHKIEIINKSMALYDACYHKNKDIVQLLLQHDADRSIRKYSDISLLDYAVENSTPEIVELLKL